MTSAFALYNGFLGIYHASLWHGTICGYYILLVVLRGTIIAAAKKLRRHDRDGGGRRKAYLAVSVLLLFMNVSLILPMALMVRQQKPGHMSLIPAIAMAAHTTYKITMASVHLRKGKRSPDRLVRLLRTIGFMDALVSILTLQNTLIMVSTKGEAAGMLPLTAVTSGAVWAALLYISVSAIRKGTTARQGDRGCGGAGMP